MEGLIDNNISDKNTVHSYLPTYTKYFERIKETTGNVLEVGIYQGGSIKLWADYFKNASVYGADINDAPEWLKTYERVTCVKGDAYNPELVQRVFGDKKFEAIIDDGPHTLESMIKLVQLYFNLLSPTGVLIIEDVQSPDWVYAIISAFPENARSKVKVVDLRQIKGRYDDLMIIYDPSH